MVEEHRFEAHTHWFKRLYLETIFAFYLVWHLKNSGTLSAKTLTFNLTCFLQHVLAFYLAQILSISTLYIY